MCLIKKEKYHSLLLTTGRVFLTKMEYNATNTEDRIPKTIPRIFLENPDSWDFSPPSLDIAPNKKPMKTTAQDYDWKLLKD